MNAVDAERNNQSYGNEDNTKVDTSLLARARAAVAVASAARRIALDVGE